jgi:hypothetical protein
MMTRARVGLVIGAIAATACAGRQTRETVDSAQTAVQTQCEPRIERLPADTDLRAAVGRYQLRLMVTSGTSTPLSSSGVMELAGTSRDTLRGTATIKLDPVGATAPGPRPADDRYSILALRWMATSSEPNITIRFGVLPAPAGTQPIEGAHMALHVGAITSDEIRGTWSSGTGDALSRGAAGHFCALRLR